MEIKHEQFVLDITLTETKPTEKQWIRAGYGKLVVAELISVNVGVMKNTENGEMFFTLPQQKGRDGKWKGVVYVEKEYKDKLNYLLNNQGVEQEAPEQEALDDVPWEVEGL